jgi:purine-binding chemotaxis protein CheW
MSKTNTSSEERYLEFHLGGESYAVELLKVREVITPPELTPIPKSPAYVCGLMNLRGLVLTVVDLRKKLNVPLAEDQSESAVIIFDLGERLVGGWVDSIHRVVNIPRDAIKPVPDSDNPQVTQHLSGIIQQQNKLILCLSIEKILGNTLQPNTKAA